MPAIRATVFGGVRPAVESQNRKATMADVAHNTLLRDTRVRAFREPLVAVPKRHFGTPGVVKDLFRFPDMDGCCGGMITFDCEHSVVESGSPGSCPGFSAITVFPSSATREPFRYFPCSDIVEPAYMPQPMMRLNPVLLFAGVLKDEDLKYRGPDERSYTYTWVDGRGVESPPAPPTASIYAYDDQTFSLTGFDTAPDGAVAVRIYRATSIFEGQTEDQDVNPATSSFQLVEEVELPVSGTLAYNDTRRLADLDYGTLLTEGDCPPPIMSQVVLTQQGYGVGFNGNDVFVSERYEMHNWPEKYRVELPDRVVGITVFYDTVFIATTGRPYRMNVGFRPVGNEADAMIDPVPMIENYPCLSRWALVTTNFGAMYPTHKGMVALAGQGPARLISRERIDEDDWLTWAPNVGAWHNGKYYGSQSPSGRSFILDITDGAEGPTDLGDLVTVDWSPDMAHAGVDGKLWFVKGGGLFAWGEGLKPLTYRWRSKQYRMPGVRSMSAAKVAGDFGTAVTLRVYADGRLYDTVTVKDSHPFRLRRNGRALVWQFEIEGTTNVTEVHIASSLAELTTG